MDYFGILSNIMVVKDIFFTVKTKYNEFKNKKKLEDTIENFQENLNQIYTNYSDKLSIIFSDINLDRIKETLKDEAGYDLEMILKKFIKNEAEIVGVCEIEATKISDMFFSVLLIELKYSAPEIYGQVRLGQEIKIIDGKLDRLSLINYKTISDIEEELLRVFFKKDKKLTLEFYNYEDKEFYSLFKNKIEAKDKVIFIDGPSREEILYNILYFFKNEDYKDTDVLVIDSHENWEKITKNIGIQNKILIPNFYNDEVKPNLNNTNIFIYNENEKVRNSNKITLYRRLRRNLEDKLQELGYSYKEVEEILRETNGIYSGVKRKIFDSQFCPPKWTEKILDDEKRKVLKKAILLGKWKNKDKDEIEYRFGIKYSDFIDKLKIVINTEEPLIIEHQSSYFLACPEEAWEYIKEYITDDEFEEFVERAIDIIGEIEDEYIKNYFREYSIYNSSKYRYSEMLKSGLLRSLTLYNPGKNHKIVKKIFEKIFEKSDIQIEIKWAYISRYILEICEISPKETLEVMIKEFNIFDGDLVKFFKKQNGYSFGKPNYYINFMWAIEVLLQIKETSIKALYLLFKINDLNIKYNMSNSPSLTLRYIFCVWKREVDITKENILLLAKTFVENYEYGWEVIKREIPSGNDPIVGSLAKPKYLSTLKNMSAITVEDYNYLLKGYIDICLEKSDSIERVLKIMDINYIKLFYEFEIFDKFKKKIENLIANSNDEGKKIIQDKIRKIIYQNRFFIRGIDDFELEELYLSIKYDNPIQEYRFLFENSFYEFPLLNPKNIVEEDYIEKNSAEVLWIIKEKFLEFKDKGYSYIDLLDLGIKNMELLGKYIFEVFSEGKLDENDLKKVLSLSKENKVYMGYINKIYIKFGRDGLEEVLEVVKSIKMDDLIVEILLMENLNLENNETPLIEKFEEFKSGYWEKMNNRFYRNEKTYRYVIENFLKYSNPFILEELSFGKDYFTADELLNYLVEIKNSQFENKSNMYFTDEIFKKIYGCYLERYDQYQKIGELELYFITNLNKGIDELKCFSYLLKKDPEIYTSILNIIYRKKDGEKYIDEVVDGNTLNRLRNFYNILKFCPSAHKNIDIEIEELSIWVKKFKELLEEQKQGYLYGIELGRLFSNSPKGKDGYYPHEAVRKIIEEFSGDELKELQRSYIIEVRNQRGAVILDTGKSEMRLSVAFRENANKIKFLSPNTAEIYYCLSEYYEEESREQKEAAIYY